MIYRVRIIFDNDKDILRDIELKSSTNLEKFHKIILESFGIVGNELASFYKSNEKWEFIHEIPLVNFDNELESMKSLKIDSLLTLKESKLLYVYDYLNLNTFFIELVEVCKAIQNTKYPNIIFSEGEISLKNSN